MTPTRQVASTEAYRILADPSFIPPPAPGGPPGGLAWLRHSVPRFSSGGAHRRRRALAVELLEAMDIEWLQRRSRERTLALLAESSGTVDVMSRIARDVPVGTLAEALGVPEVEVAAVRTVAAAYPTGDTHAEADAAVAVLVRAFGGVADEQTAAKIGLLVQACEATAALIGNSVLAMRESADVADLVNSTLQTDPPVLATIRQASDPTNADGSGDLVRVLLGDSVAPLPFGAGDHACPGRDQAVALATGVCAALRGVRLRETAIAYEPSPNLRIPARLAVIR